MSERRTAEIANSISGDALYQKRARAAFPILVRQAIAREKITYSDLVEELGMPNARNLNYVLGSIGNTIRQLRKEWKEKQIPMIQGIVVNQKTILPGAGFDPFISEKPNPLQKEAIVEKVLGEAFGYPRWLEVLEKLGLAPVKPLKTQPVLPVERRGGTAESEAHNRLKNYVAQHPKSVERKKSLAPGNTECRLPSGNVPDVLFQDRHCRIVVEVKSHLSSKDDLRRGLFQ